MGLKESVDINNLTFEMVVTAARIGDETARGLLFEAATYLGIAISDIVNILNPEKIVIGNDFVKINDIVLDHIWKIVESKALKHAKSILEISASHLGEQLQFWGQPSYLLKHYSEIGEIFTIFIHSLRAWFFSPVPETGRLLTSSSLRIYFHPDDVKIKPVIYIFLDFSRHPLFRLNW